MAWISVKSPPPLKVSSHVPWKASEPVLVFLSTGERCVATFEQTGSGQMRWYTDDEKRFDLTPFVKSWRDLGELPPPELR